MQRRSLQQWNLERYAKACNDAPAGKRFNNLVVLGKPFRTVVENDSKHESTYVVCQCDCGDICVTRVAPLISKNKGSCGCHKYRTTHGDSKTPLYKVWQFMLQRCSDKNHKAYRDYGAKGIKVCQAWKEYTIFRDWANATGYKKGLHLDRINPDQGYAPDNCQWLTPTQNAAKVTSDRKAKIANMQEQIDTLTAALVVALN